MISLPLSLVVVIILNESPAPVEWEGEVTVVDEAGALAPLSLDAAGCTDKTPPPTPVTLAVGGEHRLTWDGRLRRLVKGCWQAGPPAAGTYLLRACDSGDHVCGLTAQALPTAGPIVLRLRAVPTTPPPCDDAPLVARAAQLAVAAAKVAGCAQVKATCGARRPPDYGGACSVHVTPDERALVTFVVPPPAAGAPSRAEVRIDRDAVQVVKTRISGSTWGVAAGGRLRVRGQDGYAIHTHGGASARIRRASFAVDNETGAPIDAKVARVEWLTSHSCDPPAKVRNVAKLTSAAAVTLPAGASQLELDLEPQAAYQAWCDRFAFRVTLALPKGQTVTATAEISVSRESP